MKILKALTTRVSLILAIATTSAVLHLPMTGGTPSVSAAPAPTMKFDAMIQPLSERTGLAAANVKVTVPGQTIYDGWNYNSSVVLNKNIGDRP